jgi:WD40-like Beta Propeller Repeat
VSRAPALVALLLLGCLRPALDFAALPEQPIAFLYRTVEETERMVDEVQAREKAARPGPEDEFDIEIEGLMRLAGRRDAETVQRDTMGRVALYRAPDASLELPDALLRGARPLAWSPDRTRLMFSSSQRGGSNLFEWLPATGEVRQLTSAPELQIDGCYGPEGAIAWVQFDSTPERRGTRIWVRRPGETPRELTQGPSDSQPAWSPDGSRLVYTRVDTQGAVQLNWIDPSTGAGGSYGPGRSAAFSPDGQWIVYSARTPAGWKLRLMHADGAGKRGFGRSGFQENDPSFSPDGRFVVFSASKDERTPVTRLFVRSFDLVVDRQLMISGSGLLPVW